MATDNYFFENVDDYETINRPDKPLWTINLNDEASEKEVLNWLNGELKYLQAENKNRMNDVHKNMARYKGIQYQSQELKSNLRDQPEESRILNKKIVSNHTYDLVQNRVSRLIKYKPGYSVLPDTDDFNDRVGAKVCKNILENILYNEKFEGMISPSIAKSANVMGEGYLFITWDPEKGDMHPDWKKAQAQGLDKVPMVDESGNQKMDQLGKPMWISKPVKTGDVALEIVQTTDVYVDRNPSGKYIDADYIFRRKVYNVEEVRNMYPDKADKITNTSDSHVYDYEKMMVKTSKNDCVVWEFYHRSTNSLDKGRYICFTKDVILKSRDLPYSHGNLPCTRFTDIDLPNEIHGSSFINMIKGLTGYYNNLTNMIVRNQVLVSHPKWMVQAGSIKIDQLANDITIVQYKGPQHPILVQAQPTPAEIFNFRDKIREEFEKISGIFGVSAGAPPPGIEAGIALQFLSEQEQERWNENVLKWNEWLRQTYIMILSVAGDNYDSSDERMFKIMGKNQAWMSYFLDVANLSKSYDVRVQNSSALPQSKAARISFLTDFKQKFPNLIGDEQFVDMVDLAQEEKFINQTTVSIRSAEAETEQLLDGKKVLAPEQYEDHINHWNIHMKTIREWSFKNQTPPEVQQLLKDHVMAHEMLMTEYGMQNPLMMQKLSVLNGFPAFYLPDQMVNPNGLPLPGQEAAAQANPSFAAGPMPPEVQESNRPTNGVAEQQAREMAVPELRQ